MISKEKSFRQFSVLTKIRWLLEEDNWKKEKRDDNKNKATRIKNNVTRKKKSASVKKEELSKYRKNGGKERRKKGNKRTFFNKRKAMNNFLLWAFWELSFRYLKKKSIVAILILYTIYQRLSRSIIRNYNKRDKSHL